MAPSSMVLLFGVGCLLVAFCEGQSDYPRRVRVRTRTRPTSTQDLPADEDSERAPTVVLRRVRPLLPSPEEQQQRAAPPQVHIYSAEQDYSQDDDDSVGGARRVVIIPQSRSGGQYADSGAVQQRASYGRQVSARLDDDGARYRPRIPTEPVGTKSQRVKETSRQPPVQTIRNYSKINDDGSFTFGYEAADGSFKEETRGTDCVVRGKYGYVDPDGNKREFTYVSGNPCDPNAVEEEEEEDDRKEDDREENIPRLPIRPIQRQPIRTQHNQPAQPATTVFQQAFRKVEPTYAPVQVQQQSTTRAPFPQFTKQTRPVHTFAPTTETPPPATTYRPNVYTPTNSIITSGITYTTPTPPTTSAIVSRVRPIQQQTTSSAFDFDEELRKFQIENDVTKANAFQANHLTQQKPQQQQTYVQQPIVRQQFTQPQQQYIRPLQGSPVVQPSRVVTPVQPQAQRNPVSTSVTKTGNPIYTSQLVFDPASGQYNTILYQPLPKLNGGADINIQHRLQPYVRPQQSFQPQQIYRPLPQPYYQQQQQQQQQSPRQFYYVSPHQRSSLSEGQIDAFLRGQNIQF